MQPTNKIALLILYTESWQPIADITIPNAQKYCDKYGYELIVQKWPEPYPLNFGYNKLEQIQGIFEHGTADVVWSLDCDTLITNHNIAVQDFIDDAHDFFICQYPNGINAGSFIIKNTDWAKWFLRESLKLNGEPEMYCEQDAFREMISRLNMFGDKIKFLPHPSINSVQFELYPEFGQQEHKGGQWVGGDFVLHLPALSIEKRIEILKNTKIIYE